MRSRAKRSMRWASPALTPCAVGTPAAQTRCAPSSAAARFSPTIGRWSSIITGSRGRKSSLLSICRPSREMLRDMSIDTLFLDAGGVLCHPSWTRVADALNRHGAAVTAAALAAAEQKATYDIDKPSVIGATDDRARGWLYFNLVLQHAGVPQSDATDAALAELREYHRHDNLWEHVESDVAPALAALKSRGLKLVVVSNANGRLRHLFDRVDLTKWFDHVLDSHEWGVEKPDPRLFKLALEQSRADASRTVHVDRKSTRLNSSHLVISYAVFCLKKKKQQHRPAGR